MIKKYHSDFHSSILNRLLLLIVTGLLASSAAFAQTASISPTPAALTEANLNTASLGIVLGGGETFIDATLPVGSFALVGAPTGTSITSVTWTSTTAATIVIAFNSTDFDSDQSISINILAGELTLTSSGVLSVHPSSMTMYYFENSVDSTLLITGRIECFFFCYWL